MNIVIDTNILGRMAEPGNPQAQLALDATDALRKQGDVPCVLPQILYEFWVVATRPAAQNGLGLSAVQAETELVRIEAMFPLLAETAAVFPEWRRLIRASSRRQECSRLPHRRGDGDSWRHPSFDIRCERLHSLRNYGP